MYLMTQKDYNDGWSVISGSCDLISLSKLRAFVSGIQLVYCQCERSSCLFENAK